MVSAATERDRSSWAQRAHWSLALAPSSTASYGHTIHRPARRTPRQRRSPCAAKASVLPARSKLVRSAPRSAQYQPSR